MISAPDAGPHTVWIYKATEAHTGPVVIKQITGTDLKPLTKPAAPTIEFMAIKDLFVQRMEGLQPANHENGDLLAADKIDNLKKS